MKISLSVVYFSFASVFLQSFVALAWDGKKDNRPVAELDLMNDEELAEVAIWPCMFIARQRNSVHYDSSEKTDEAYEYLQTIKLVARKKHGEVPEWVDKVYKAAEGWESSKCISVHMELLLDQIRHRHNPALKKKKR